MIPAMDYTLFLKTPPQEEGGMKYSFLEFRRVNAPSIASVNKEEVQYLEILRNVRISRISLIHFS